MRALLLNSYGSPPQVELVDVEDPVPGPDQMRVRVHTAGLNPIDKKILAGFLAEAMPKDLPAGIGFDVAGVVDAIGADVTAFDTGDAVVAIAPNPNGALADYVIVDAASPAVASKPALLGFDEAAVVPMVATTAATIARTLLPAKWVVVIGASGGIGRFLVPALASRRCEVIATGHARDREWLTSAGAAIVIDRDSDLHVEIRTHLPDGADAVIDLVNQFDGLLGSAALVRDGGQLLTTLPGPSENDLPSGITLRQVHNEPVPGELDAAIATVADKRVVLPVERAASLSTAAPLLADYTAGVVRGKVAFRAVGSP